MTAPGLTGAEATAPRSSALADLGILIEEQGSVLKATMPAVANLAVPGTTAMRICALCALADTQLGLLAVRELGPRVPVTLALDVHLFQPVPVSLPPARAEGPAGAAGSVGAAGPVSMVHATGRVVKAGRAVLVTAIEFADDTGRPLGVGTALFMVAPDPMLLMPPGMRPLDLFATTSGELAQPYAQRLGCRRVGAGVASLPFTDDVVNASGTLNGGILPLAVEEAVLSAAPGSYLTSLSLQYLRPVRRGPAVARAEVRGDVGTVEVHDAGTDALAVVATARTSPAHTVTRTSADAAGASAPAPEQRSRG
ncbi:Acyl-coenzyme A thioesterase PaaI, contains HGG motif [Parafrankia irregularis]|uniref:Acyl-coenzyme A thioesterase PaaI, contains HGG motif n=2 Tax=Frankiaceae TaxID=74712 RepID=A0A0S4QPT5_9ACTN|nr:Acyl-coenzyme A thioesterase PaaI, contains HGG motif [Parafrankia irregularis]